MMVSILIGALCAMYFQSNQPHWYENAMTISQYDESATQAIAFGVTLSLIVAGMLGTHIAFGLMQKIETLIRRSQNSVNRHE